MKLGRTLHLVDIENLMSGPDTGLRSLFDAAESYRTAAHSVETDSTIVAANPGLMPWMQDAFPSARVYVGSGTDGADRALLRAAGSPDFIARRHDRVVIGSGDGIFAGLARDITTLGIPVEIVCHAAALSNSLMEVGTIFRPLVAWEPGRAA